MNPDNPAGQRLGIEETTDVVISIADVFTAVTAARADGKIKFLEAAGFLTLLPSILRGLNGIAKVPAELKDLSPGELDALLLELIRREIIPADARARDRLDIIVRLVWEGLRALREWLNIDSPPKAQPQAED